MTPAMMLVTETEALRRETEAFNRGRDAGVQKLTDTDGERIKALEIHHELMAEQMKDMVAKVDEIHSILLQARGARWAILAVAGFAGFLSAKLSWLLTLFGAKM